MCPWRHEPEVELKSLPTSTVRILWRPTDHGQEHGPARWALDRNRPITELAFVGQSRMTGSNPRMLDGEPGMRCLKNFRFFKTVFREMFVCRPFQQDAPGCLAEEEGAMRLQFRPARALIRLSRQHSPSPLRQPGHGS
jgi:hypothetical protein